MPRLATVAGSVLVLAATLTGCGPGSNAEPGKLPSNLKTSTPAPTATPSAPTAPTRPAAVTKKNKVGAIAATRYFLDALTYSGPANDTKPLRMGYIAHCTKCEAMADYVDQIYENGGRIEGGGWLPQRFTVYSVGGRVAVLDAIVDEPPQEWSERAGAKTQTYAGTENRLRAFNLRWTGAEGWKVSAVDPDA